MKEMNILQEIENFMNSKRLDSFLSSPNINQNITLINQFSDVLKVSNDIF